MGRAFHMRTRGFFFAISGFCFWCINTTNLLYQNAALDYGTPAFFPARRQILLSRLEVCLSVPFMFSLALNTNVPFDVLCARLSRRQPKNSLACLSLSLGTKTTERSRTGFYQKPLSTDSCSSGLYGIQLVSFWVYIPLYCCSMYWRSPIGCGVPRLT